MYQLILKISVLSFVLLSNVVSFGMLTINIQQLPNDIRKHIFVVACPFTKNQLKNSCKEWHEIGSKKAPNMYRLIDDESFNPSRDDWRYIMMHAALDENIEVMKNILDRTSQRNFDYDCYEKIGFRLCDMFVIQRLQSDNNNWKKEAPEKFKELDLTSNNLHECGVTFSSLFMTCFAGDSDKVQLEFDAIIDDKMVECANDRLDYCLGHKADCVDLHPVDLHRIITIYGYTLDSFYIAIYNDNAHCIKALSSLKIKHEPNQELHLDLLFMAMKKQKKQAFKALVENNVYGRLDDVHVNYMYGGWTRTTTLDELCKQTDIPNIAEYIALYKELGGKTLREMEYDEDRNNTDFVRSLHCCSLQ